MTTSNDLREIKRDQGRERRAEKERRQRVRQRMEENRDRNASERAEQIRIHNAVVTGLVPRIGGAIDSWVGKRVPLSVRYPSPRFRAITDFTSIELHIPDEEVTFDFAADLRGLAYHEAGHILKSMPFPVLLDAVLPLLDPDDDGTRRAFMDKVIGCDTHLLHHAWNCLEDQRMETAMVRESINLGRYYQVIVLTHVLSKGIEPSKFLLLHGRRHVDQRIRESAAAAFASAYGTERCERAERIIDTYKRATDVFVMWEQVVLMARLIMEIGDGGGSIDEHTDGGEYGEPCEDGEPGEGWGQKIDDSADPGDEAGESGAGSKGEGDEEDGESDGGTADRGSPTVSKGDGPGAKHSKGTPDWTRELVKEVLEEAKEERNEDQQLRGDIRAYNEALRSARDSLPIERVPVTPNPDPEVTSKAIGLSRALRNMMEQARAQSAPAWQVGQDHGYLDVRAWVTRQPGDTDFYRNFAEDGDMRLPNMAVSILLDGSASMYHNNEKLAAAAFGMKLACDTVNVPCTVTIYDTDAYLLWDHEDEPLDAPLSVVPGGGTDPRRAMDLVDLQKHEKHNHLVIIMTDGQWQGDWYSTRSLAHYSAPDRDMVLFYFGSKPSKEPLGVEACGFAEPISDLDEMPRFLLRYFTRAM